MKDEQNHPHLMVVEVAVDGEPVSLPPGPRRGREPAPLAHSRCRAAEGPGQGSAVRLLLALGRQSAALVTQRTCTQERTGQFRRYLRRDVVTEQSRQILYGGAFPRAGRKAPRPSCRRKRGVLVNTTLTRLEARLLLSGLQRLPTNVMQVVELSPARHSPETPNGCSSRYLGNSGSSADLAHSTPPRLGGIPQDTSWPFHGWRQGEGVMVPAQPVLCQSREPPRPVLSPSFLPAGISTVTAYPLQQNVSGQSLL